MKLLCYKRRVGLTFLSLLMLLCSVSAQLPAGFTANIVQEGYTAPMSIVFSSNGNLMFISDKSGHIYVSKWNGASYDQQATVVLDISDEVGDWRDFGLLSFCLDPDFDANGLVYLYYVVDRYHLLNAGTPQYNNANNAYFDATIGRVTRYRLNMGTTISTDYSSRKILIGETKKTGIPLLHESHMGGTIVFGRDKTLLLSTGDGASYTSVDAGSASETYYQQALLDSIIRPQENVGAFRSQMLNSLSGKILRFDPNTGDGITSNPFYDAVNPRSAKSRVWSTGFRNPFRMCLKPNTGSVNPGDADPGTLLVGDVGMNTWEEFEVVHTGGLNCGWPLYEGQLAHSGYMAVNTVNTDEGQTFKSLCLQPTSFTINATVTNRRLTHYRPATAWKHGTTDARVPWFSGTTPTDPQVGAAGSPTTGQLFGGNCSIGGLFYTSAAFGPTYQNTYFFADYGSNWIKVANLNTSQPWVSNISNFAPDNFANGVVNINVNPLDNTIFYVNINTGEIMRISLGTNLPPVAVVSSNVSYGASPLTVDFSSAGSINPNGGMLQYLWDFGDGSTSTQANPSHAFSGAGVRSFTVTLTVTNSTNLSSSKSVLISINNTPPSALITNPVNNSTYSVLNENLVPLAANVTDNETATGMQYAWQVTLRHNNHEHREPVNTNPNPTVNISPVGCDGETYYYLIQLTVTDNGGLTAKDSVKIFPNCSTAGLSVTNLTATAQSNNILLSWTNPATPFNEVMIAAQASTGFLTNPIGTNYIADANFTGTGTAFEQGKIIYKGTGQSVSVTNLNAGTLYYFRVFTRIGNSWNGGVETSAMIATGLSAVGVASSATVNLSTEGSADWAHWNGYDHKSTGGSKISNYVLVGTGTVSNYPDDPRTCTWNDGTPTVSGSNQNGIYIAGIGKGFQITAPADLNSRILKVYVGGWVSGGTLTAQLSDGSSPDYVNSDFSGTGQYNAVYTLTYKAASANKLLTVKWVQASGAGNVTLQAATLVQSAAAVNVTGVTVSPTSATIAVNGTQQITATIAPANASNQNVSWSSSNNAVAAVNTTGLVTALTAGTSTITITTQDGNKTAVANITCIPIAVTAVTVNPTAATIAVNGTRQLTASIAPANASNQNVSWTSSDITVATVNTSGLVTALSAGTATITVTTQDGNLTAVSAITCSLVAVTGVTVNPTAATLILNGTQQLTATIAPANASNQNISWSSSNNAVAAVNTNGMVTALSVGTATITVTTQDGNITATCTITVNPAPLGSLTGSGLSSSATINLSTEGTADWAHWNGYDHKSTGGSKISNYALVGTGTVGNYPDDPRTCTWNDGTPTVSGSNKNGIYIAGIGKGFQITAPADLISRTLKVYVGGWVSGGTLTAQLSDGSAANYVNSSFSGTGQYNAVYTLTYNAGSAGKLLTVKWVQASGAGNVTLQAATLVQSAAAVNVTGVTVNPTSATIIVNATQQLTATIAPANASNQNVSWTSSNNTVATVSATGLVTALTAGTATITVTTQDGNKTAVSNITCIPVAVTGVTVNPTSATLAVNGTQQLTAAIAPANASNQNVSWTSSDNTVAIVSATGMITALSVGTATITVTTQDGNLTAACNITCSLVSVTGITVNPTSATLTINGTQQLTATIAPANASNQNVSWTSSDNSIAIVSATGLVTALSAGTATITVTTQDANITATCNVTCTLVSVTGVTVSPTSATLAINGTQQLTATITPANANNQNISWSSSNNAVASVNNNGLVTALANGSATITVTTQDGNITATCNVTVPIGSLTGSGLSSSATVNLSTEGTADWAHWNGYDHKSTGGSKISNYVVVGTGTVNNYTNDPRTCTWNDGTPTVSGSNKNGIYITGIGKGFQITAPADLTSRTLKVYVGGWVSGGTLTAQLSDGSAANYVNSSFSGTGQYNAVYTLTYNAASAGKLLTVKWVQASGAGNVTLQAATLVQSATFARSTIENNDTKENIFVDGLLSVSPNPFYNTLTLNYSGKQYGSGTIVLYNSEMKLISINLFEKASWNMYKKIAVQGLTAGVYFVQLNIGTTKITKQLIKIY